MTTVKRVGVRTLAFAGLWLALVEGDLQHPIVALASVLATAAMGVRTRVGAGWRIKLWGLARFIPFFIRASWSGGIDVAARAFRRGHALDPVLIHHEFRVAQDSPARALMITVVSLLPGTLSADVEGGELTVHVIDRGADPRELLDRLEHRVAALFGHPLDRQAGGS